MDVTVGGMTWEDKVDHWALTLMVPVLVIWLAISLTTTPEAAGRQAGGILQLLGFVVGALALQEKLARFSDKPGLREMVSGWLQRAARWLKGLFGWKPEGRTLSAQATGVASAGGSVNIKQQAGPNASLERRVEILEAEQERLRTRFEQLRREVSETRAELEEEMEELQRQLNEVEEKAEKLVAELAIGSLHWEASGLFWFILGVVATTWPSTIPGA